MFWGAPDSLKHCSFLFIVPDFLLWQEEKFLLTVWRDESRKWPSLRLQSSEDPCWSRSDRLNDWPDTKICCFWLLFLLILLSAYSEHGIQETLTETVWKKEKEWCDLTGGSKTCGSNSIFTVQAWKRWPGNHLRVAALMVQHDEGRGGIKPATFVCRCCRYVTAEENMTFSCPLPPATGSAQAPV